jgi:tetratricopeptide (TPR) repeat protein
MPEALMMTTSVPRLRRAMITTLMAGSLLMAADAAAEEPFACPAVKQKAKRNAEAKRLFQEALRLEPGAPEAALERLDCADGLVDRPAVALRIGVIADRLQRDQKAIAGYERYLELAGDDAPDEKQIRERIAKLEERAAAKQAPEPAPTAAAGAAPDSGGEVPAGRRTAGIVIAATGGALGIAGGVLLAMAGSDNDELQDAAPGTVVWDSDDGRGLHEQAQLKQALGIGGLALGATAIGVGLGLALTPSSKDSKSATEAGARLHVTPGGIRLEVPFGPGFGL